MSADWRFFVTERSGAKLREVTAIASQRKGSWRLRRPASLTLRLPANDSRVSALHTDGMPIVKARARGLKAYRREYVPALFADRYVLRFGGFVYTVQDVGDDTGAWTTLTAFDPMQELAARLCRDGTRRYADAEDTKLVEFTNVDNLTIARTLIDRTNAVYPTGIQWSGGGSSMGSPRTVHWERKMVYPALLEIAEAENGFDFLFDPVDQANGAFVNFQAMSQAGTYKPNVRFNWGAKGKSNVRSISRLEDGLPYSNSVLGLGTPAAGGDQLVSVQYDPVDQGLGHAESVRTYSDVVDQSYLTDRTARDLAKQERLRDTIVIVPGGVSAKPWTDFTLGDTFDVYAPNLRGGPAETRRRIFGWDLSMDDVETLDRLVLLEEGT